MRCWLHEAHGTISGPRAQSDAGYTRDEVDRHAPTTLHIRAHASMAGWQPLQKSSMQSPNLCNDAINPMPHILRDHLLATLSANRTTAHELWKPPGAAPIVCIQCPSYNLNVSQKVICDRSAASCTSNLWCHPSPVQRWQRRRAVPTRAVTTTIAD
jgi:hypothetical protein